MRTGSYGSMTERGAQVPVLIVGAGPTGLAMALGLARHGVRCLVIDAAPAPSTNSKALAVQARTLEVLEALGVAAPVLQKGLVLRGFNVYADGRRLARWALEFIDSRYNYILSLEQSETERLLIDRVAARGVAGARPRQLARGSQDAGGVTAVLRDAEGREETLRADWLIGCDGAHSTVRHALGLAFEGAAYEDDFRLADVRIDWPLAADEVHVFLRPSDPIGVIPLPGGYHRVIVILPKPQSGAAEREPRLDFFEDQLRDAAPAGTRVYDPVWLTSFRIHRRMVDRYRVGRVFLAGDAAHIHSPAGGQGMNTGIQDAFNLAWKLALVANGAAGEELLDTYHAERYGVARAVLRATDIGTRMIAWRGPVAHRLRRFIVPRLLGRAALRRRLGNAIGGVAINYRRSPIVECATAAAGQRIADIDLEAPDGSATRLHQVLDHTRHTLLLLSSATTPAEVEALSRLAAVVARDWRDVITSLWISADGAFPAPGAEIARALRDPAGALHKGLRARLVLVRPDGYVGYCRARIDQEAFRAYLAGLFGGPA